MRAVLRNGPFRRLLLGRAITNAGDSLYVIATLWLVHDLSSSAIYTGLAGSLVYLPPAIQFLVGPLVDRWDLRRVLVGTQIVQFGLVLIVPLAAVVGLLSVPLVLVIVPLAGMVNQFLYPAQNRALPRFVSEEELADANSMLSITYEGVDTLFNAIGGVLVTLLGAVALYTIDAVSFALVALLFATIRIPRPKTDRIEADQDDGETLRGYLEELREGLRYVAGSIFGVITGLTGIMNFAYGGLIAVLPSFAAVRGGAGLFGILMAAIAAGRLAGSVAGPRLQQFALGRLMIGGFAFGGVAWFVGTLSGSVPVTVVSFCLAMVPVGVANVLHFTFLQTHAPEQMLGRASSITGSMTAIAVPMGSLVGGVVGDLWGVHVVVMGVSVSLLVLGMAWLVHPLLRTIPPIREANPATYGLAPGPSARDD